MKTITTSELVTVTGGVKTSDAVTTQLTALQGSIKDLASAQSKPAGNDSMTTMMMMMAMRPQPQQTVVAAPAAAAAPVINVDTRVRR